MELVDVEGKTHPLSEDSVYWMIRAGWFFFAGSFFFNGLYYKIHPSSTDISWRSIIQRLKCQKEEDEIPKDYYYNVQPKEESSAGYKDPYHAIYRMYRHAGQRSGSSRSNLFVYRDYYGDETENTKDYIGIRRRTLRFQGSTQDFDQIVNDRDLFEIEYGYKGSIFTTSSRNEGSEDELYPVESEDEQIYAD